MAYGWRSPPGAPKSMTHRPRRSAIVRRRRSWRPEARVARLVGSKRGIAAGSLSSALLDAATQTLDRYRRARAELGFFGCGRSLGAERREG
jgi:hypothetical protein